MINPLPGITIVIATPDTITFGDLTDFVTPVANTIPLIWNIYGRKVDNATVRTDCKIR
jgi:hypothetical protein